MAHEPQQVQIGSNTFTIDEFSAFQAVYAGEIVAGASQQVQLLMEKIAQFNRDYREKNKVAITKAISVMRGYDLPDDAFNAEGVAYLPDAPDQIEIIGYIFPEAFRLARTEVLKVLALAILSPNELADYERQGGEVLDKALEERGDRLLFECKLGDLIALAAAVVTEVQATIEEQAEHLGKLRGLLQRNRDKERQVEPEQLSGAVTVTRPPENDSQTSFMDSPEPTDGTGDTSPTQPASATP